MRCGHRPRTPCIPARTGRPHGRECHSQQLQTEKDGTVYSGALLNDADGIVEFSEDCPSLKLIPGKTYTLRFTLYAQLPGLDVTRDLAIR